jgi:hypothetical protein
MAQTVISISPNAPATVNVTVQQGGDLLIQMQMFNQDGSGNPDLSSPYNLSGYTLSGMVRKTQAITGVLVVPLTLTWVDIAHGRFDVKLTNAQTAAIVAGSVWYFDVKGTIGGFEVIFFGGSFTVQGRATSI